MAGLELAQKQLLAIWKEVDVDNSGFLDFEEFCFLAQKLQAVMDMSQQEVDDGNDSAAAAQRDAIHNFHRQNAPTRQARLGLGLGLGLVKANPNPNPNLTLALALALALAPSRSGGRPRSVT